MRDNGVTAKLEALRTRLVAWLVDAAYPLWAQHGIDPQNGGFIETLGQNGVGLPHPRRARVHPRQIYAFAQAPGLGWKGDVQSILQRGMDYFVAHYRRPDGLFRTLASVDGAPLDDQALLYDQAFALLGYAAAAEALDARGEFEKRALELRAAIESRFRADNGAFRSSETLRDSFESNPHMHLLEACLAWAETGNDRGWSEWVRQIVELATRRFIRPDAGSLGESFTADWRPAPEVAGRIVEPGHQFEWAWLLLRCENRHPGPLRETALRLIAIGEQSGVHNQVAINALLDDFSVHDANARFWPQTERLKAALLAARLTEDGKYWEMAAAAAASLLPYLNTPVPGLWFDVQLPSGELVDSPAPASTFYHLVGAIMALDSSLTAS
ncbi:MAG TPA: AGE family epimerase/isomerase [Steroidobacteraceae bacterium]|nr:AGE family epimerase/isomerase [Steroidobacteraceae bacterium]